MRKWLKWRRDGKPMIEHPGFHCGICGNWVNQPFKIRDYQSLGDWVDRVGLCNKHKSIGGQHGKRAVQNIQT